jgi:hypothetical protein
MKVFRSTVGLGSLAALLAALLLGLGLGQVSATTGPQGAARAAGGPTLDLNRHRSVLVEGTVGARGNLSVPCPTGNVVGGGFSHVGSNLRVIESRPDGIYAWRVSWIQTSTDDSVLYVYAVCLITMQ